MGRAGFTPEGGAFSASISMLCERVPFRAAPGKACFSAIPERVPGTGERGATTSQTVVSSASIFWLRVSSS
jgi:hypothetical protein